MISPTSNEGVEMCCLFSSVCVSFSLVLRLPAGTDGWKTNAIVFSSDPVYTWVVTLHCCCSIVDCKRCFWVHDSLIEAVFT